MAMQIQRWTPDDGRLMWPDGVAQFGTHQSVTLRVPHAQGAFGLPGNVHARPPVPSTARRQLATGNSSFVDLGT
jgi:hypothetical protein